MKTTGYIITTIVLIIISLFFGQNCLAEYDNIFQTAIETAVDQAIDAWIKEDNQKLKAALEKLALNEAYNMVVGQSIKDRSYLTRVPKSLNHSFNTVAAYLYLIRKEKENINLQPISIFEGKKFQFIPTGEK